MRDGLRRLCLLQLGTTLAKLEGQLPGSLAQTRRQLVLRALDEAFQLGDPQRFPRNRVAFSERLAQGRVQLPIMLTQLASIAADVTSELAKVQLALKALSRQPGALPRAVVDDVQSQLTHVAPPALLRVTSLARLDHIVRYLRAIQVRLQRQAHDPQKDQHKAAQVTPLWQRYVTKRDELRAKGRSTAELDEFGWLVEELRVQTFAPELKTAVSVSPQRLQDLWAIISR
jgi:ATP-dependent helicase HrpA